MGIVVTILGHATPFGLPTGLQSVFGKPRDKGCRIDIAAIMRTGFLGPCRILRGTELHRQHSAGLPEHLADPFKDPTAERYERLTYDEALARKLQVMDATAIVMCREHDLPLKVFNVNRHGDLVRVVCGGDLGTSVVRE